MLGADAVKANPFLQGMTPDDVLDWAHRKMGGQGGAPRSGGPTLRDDVDMAAVERSRVQDELDAAHAALAEVAGESSAAVQRALDDGAALVPVHGELAPEGAPLRSEPRAGDADAPEAGLDRQFAGGDRTGLDLWRRSELLAAAEERGAPAAALEALLGAERADALRDTARAYRAGTIDERAALDTVSEAELDRYARFEQATARPADREGYYFDPRFGDHAGDEDLGERSLAEVIAELDQGTLALRAEGSRVANTDSVLPGTGLQAIESDTGRVVEARYYVAEAGDAFAGSSGDPAARGLAGGDAAPPGSLDQAEILRRAEVRGADLKQWDDPAGAAAQAQADSVLHDLKASIGDDGGADVSVQLEAEGGPQRLEAMLDEIDEDFSIVAAIKECL